MHDTDRLILKDWHANFLQCYLSESRAMSLFLSGFIFPPIVIPKDCISSQRSFQFG